MIIMFILGWVAVAKYVMDAESREEGDDLGLPTHTHTFTESIQSTSASRRNSASKQLKVRTTLRHIDVNDDMICDRCGKDLNEYIEEAKYWKFMPASTYIVGMHLKSNFEWQWGALIKTDGKKMFVTQVQKGHQFHKLGIRKGWRIHRVDGLLARRDTMFKVKGILKQHKACKIEFDTGHKPHKLEEGHDEVDDHKVGDEYEVKLKHETDEGGAELVNESEFAENITSKEAELEKGKQHESEKEEDGIEIKQDDETGIENVTPAVLEQGMKDEPEKADSQEFQSKRSPESPLDEPNTEENTERTESINIKKLPQDPAESMVTAKDDEPTTAELPQSSEPHQEPEPISLGPEKEISENSRLAVKQLLPSDGEDFTQIEV